MTGPWLMLSLRKRDDDDLSGRGSSGTVIEFSRINFAANLVRNAGMQVESSIQGLEGVTVPDGGLA